ncbi:MAG: VWA-like domain-containing protein [Rubrivivax sp.]|nr:VWA-like domain-containing protein [Rubrivivax sp.]MDP3612200.1 VWA-like domain-containing protein [Rubrivivax sp.]
MEGGGDTHFTPLLEEACRHRPDLTVLLTVLLTDLQAPAGHRPPGAVLGAGPPAFAHAPAPFGRQRMLR